MHFSRDRNPQFYSWGMDFVSWELCCAAEDRDAYYPSFLFIPFLPTANRRSDTSKHHGDIECNSLCLPLPTEHYRSGTQNQNSFFMRQPWYSLSSIERKAFTEQSTRHTLGLVGAVQYNTNTHLFQPTSSSEAIVSVVGDWLSLAKVTLEISSSSRCRSGCLSSIFPDSSRGAIGCKR